LVTASSTAGSASLHTLAMSTGPAGNSYPDAPLATLTVAGSGETPAPAVTVPMPGVAPDLTNATIARRRTLTLSEDNNGMYINGKMFDFAQSIFDTPATLGTVEEWTIRNVTGEMHPFHIHVSSFQVMSIDGVPQKYDGARDVEWVPHTNKDGSPGELVIRIPFRDFTGRYMFHCHIAGHEDAGMMSFINVVA
jgi:FtsP/CotA-like multicopper oxidase with cupredoxin domain